MKNSEKIKSIDWTRGLLTASIFVVMLLIIAVLYPGRIGSFSYHFEQGRPWMYGELCAEEDFPILKSADDLTAEQAAALTDFAPFLTRDNALATRQIKQIMDSATAVLLPAERAFLRQELQVIYASGVVSMEDKRVLAAEGYASYQSVVDHKVISTSESIADLFTPKTAYEHLIRTTPEGEMTRLNRMSLNLMLLPNMRYDSVMTTRLREEIVASIPRASGQVLRGQKIVDRGEIVTEEIYQQLRSLEANMEAHGTDRTRANWAFGATVVLITLFIVLMVLYLNVFRQQLFLSYSTLLFFALLMTIVIAMACLVVRFTSWSIYIVPFAWVPIIVRVFYDSRTALYLHMVVTLICSFLAPAPFEFVVLQMAIGMVAVSSLKDMAQRAQLVRTAVLILCTYCLCYTSFIIAAKGNPEYLHWHMYLYFCLNALFLGIVSYGLIYVFEKMFGLVSSITLVELTNINSDLLVEFSEKAPGSFQHSLQVSNLAVEAAKRVGANPLLVRTGAMYHDIGKMHSPELFTENQQDGQNPLLQMSHEGAAQAIIAHVKNGVEIARRHHLPEVVEKFITMHHGTSKVRYFYNSYMNAHPGAKVDESLFTYPGPRPNTKEVAILMMSDAVEARSRSLTEFSEESIRRMVDQMINAQVADGQFEETPLTFHDIREIKEVFCRKLIAMNHHRIVYPELRFDSAEKK